jgi:hypothetical protein
MPYKNPMVRRSYNMAYQPPYYRNHKQAALARQRRRKSTARLFLQSRKSAEKCSRCGESDVRCLDFHHRPGPVKVAGLARMATDGASIKALELELKKCVVLCKNCHAKEHFKNLMA